MAKAKDKTTPEAAASNGSNGAIGDPDTGQLLDKQTLDDLSVLDLDPGGPTPSKSILKMGSASKDIGNQFKQEEEVIFKVHARCEEVGFKGVRRVHHFDVIDIFQDEDLDADLIERFKDKLEGYETDADIRVAITDFLDSCLVEETDAASPADDEDIAALAAPDAPEEEVEEVVEVVEGEIIDEGDPEATALEEAAGDLDWSSETSPQA